MATITSKTSTTMSESDARRILCVSERASLEEIKKSRSRLIHINHPDLASTDLDSQKRTMELMMQINTAWNVIQYRETHGLLGFPFNFSPAKLIPASLLDFIGVVVTQDQMRS